MTTTASEQLKRILHLIPRLADEAEHPLDDLATITGTAREDLMSILGSLSERFDAPGGFVEGVSIFVENDSVTVHANHFHRPMRLTMPELVALELGLGMLRRERTPGEQAPIDSAQKRLREAISQVPSNERHEGTRYAELAAAGSADHLALLRDAHRRRRKASLRYRSSGSTESTERIVSPHAILFAEQMWYVLAVCEDAEPRFFRLDRVEGVVVLEEEFEPDAAVVQKVMVGAKAFASDTKRRMTVRYSPRIARWVAEREGKSLEADGSLTMEHPVADDAWAIRHVLQYGPEAELLEPMELREQLLQRLTALKP
jgi:predicted DNA-binding transcriptional regulator YafY